MPAVAMTNKPSTASTPPSAVPTSAVVARTSPRVPTHLDARDAALEFMDGALGGWDGHQFVDWCRRRLLGRGLLSMADPISGRLATVEEGAGRVVIPTSPYADIDPIYLPYARRLVEVARGRVVSALSGFLRSPLDDRFVSAAIYAGRVRRVRAGDAVTWQPSLREGEPVSHWVLALFAVDALGAREDYDQKLSLCESCGAVSFAPDRQRRRCPAHLDVGAPSGRKNPR